MALAEPKDFRSSATLSLDMNLNIIKCEYKMDISNSRLDSYLILSDFEDNKELLLVFFLTLDV